MFFIKLRLLFGDFKTFQPIKLKKIICENYFRTFHTSNSLLYHDNNEQFIQHENQHAHDLLQKMLPYQSFVLPNPRFQILENFTDAETNGSSDDNLVKSLQSHIISITAQQDKENLHPSPGVIKNNYLQLNHDCGAFSKLVSSICRTLPRASDKEIINYLSSLCLWPPTERNPNVTLLENALDKECCKRHMNWSTEKQLFVADIYFHLYMCVYGDYTTKLITLLGWNLKKIPRPHLIYLLFQINLKRQAHYKLMDAVENQIEPVIGSLSMEEIVIVALAFFKTSHRIYSVNLLDKIISALTNSMNRLHPLSMSAIVKVLEYSYVIKHKPLIKDFLVKANERELWKKCFQLAVHLSKLGNKENIYFPELLDNVVGEMLVAKHVRIKDLDGVLLTVSRFNHKLKNHNQVIDFYRRELRNPSRRDEIEMFPSCFLNCLLYLSMFGIYEEDLISRVFSKKFTKLLIGQQVKISDGLRGLATLDCFVELDVPLYRGCRLDADLRAEITNKQQKHYNTFSRIYTIQESVTLDILSALQQLTKLELKPIHLLPYLDDPVCLFICNSNGCLEAPPEDIYALAKQGQIVLPKDTRKWIVVFPINKSLYISDTKLLMGKAIKSLVHLENLGFTVIKMDSIAYYSLSRRKKLEYIESELTCF